MLNIEKHTWFFSFQKLYPSSKIRIFDEYVCLSLTYHLMAHVGIEVDGI